MVPECDGMIKYEKKYHQRRSCVYIRTIEAIRRAIQGSIAKLSKTSTLKLLSNGENAHLGNVQKSIRVKLRDCK